MDERWGIASCRERHNTEEDVAVTRASDSSLEMSLQFNFSGSPTPKGNQFLMAPSAKILGNLNQFASRPEFFNVPVG